MTVSTLIKKLAEFAETESGSVEVEIYNPIKEVIRNEAYTKALQMFILWFTLFYISLERENC